MELSWKFLEDGTLYVEDPVYKKPYVLPAHIAGMFETKEMKRLQKIKQTDYSWIDWPGLENDKRWRHSMGVAHLGYELFEKFSKGIFAEYGIEIDNMEREIAECVLAAHDIGHLDNSHHSEKLIQYSHELRTVDILLGDTEVGRYLRSRYPQAKIEEVVSIIAKINNDEEIDSSTLSPLMQLYSQVVSSSYDIDKIDYTIGDSYYAGIPTGVEPMEIINGFRATVDKDGNLRLVINEKAQRQGERLQIERFQNYRDIYYSASSKMMDNIAPIIFRLIIEEPEEVKAMIPDVFLKKMEAGVAGRRITTLEEELQMTDDVTDGAYEILRKQAHNPILRYLCDAKAVRRDFKIFTTNRNMQDYMEELQSIFPGRDLSNTKSLFINNYTCKLKKQNEDFLIEKENGEIVSVEKKAGSVIKPQTFNLRRVYFNPELLRLELGLSQQEFEQYKSQLESFIDNMGEKTEEFQARYVLENKGITQRDIINMLKEHGFHFIETSYVTNVDDYYDTTDFDFLKQGKELRGRRSVTQDSEKISAMYKSPVGGSNEPYTVRKIFEVSTGVENTSLEEIKRALSGQVGDLDGVPLEDKPMLHADTNRTKMYFVRNGKFICVAWDETIYNNKWFGKKATDIMIEVQNKRGTSRLILKAIGQIFSKYPEKINKCQDSKMLRGARLTRMQKEQPEGDLKVKPQQNNIEREKKIHFSEGDRQKLEVLLPEVLKELGFDAEAREFAVSEQTDYYFDTPSLYYGKSKGVNSLRTRELANGKLKSTYKTSESSNSNIAERKEIESTPKSTSPADFIKAMSEKGVAIYPSNLELVTQVINHRKKLLFRGSGIELELAIDDVTNKNPKTKTSKKAEKGEIEMEIKSAQIPVEKQREILENIWQKVIEKCQKEGISLSQSKHNKYVDSLIELGLLKEREQEEK